MKKVCIVTVYNSSNYGGFMQAYALKKSLVNMGCEVVFLKNKARNPKVDLLRNIITKIKVFKFDLKGYKYQIEKSYSFSKVKNQFDEIPINEDFQNIDLFVFGSDEIWNIRRKRIRKYPSFFGCGLPNTIKKISYSPSINTSDISDFESEPEIVKSLLNFSSISVRDSHSKEVIEKVLGEEILQTIDPTLLIDKNQYLVSLNYNLKDEKYLVVYTYGHQLKEDMIEIIQSFAKSKKLKIVSLLEYLPWADYSLSLDPFEMLGILESAEYIFTDTFHGILFSMIFEKRFYIMSLTSNKITEIVKEFDLNDFLIQTDNFDIKNEPIWDFELINKLIIDKRKQSLSYLERSIK